MAKKKNNEKIKAVKKQDEIKETVIESPKTAVEEPLIEEKAEDQIPQVVEEAVAETPQEEEPQKVEEDIKPDEPAPKKTHRFGLLKDRRTIARIIGSTKPNGMSWNGMINEW